MVVDEFSPAYSAAFDAVGEDLPDLCWPVDHSCIADWDTYPPDVQARADALAVTTLQSLTGYQVGGCPVTVRPCRADCAGGFDPYNALTAHQNAGLAASSGTGWGPVYRDGGWVNLACGCRSGCSCTTVCEVRLPVPVGGISEVKVDGAIVDPTMYRLIGDRLVWTGPGDCLWPYCQNLAAPDTEAGTFAVTYLNAWPVDGLGSYAAGQLAGEFAKACSGGKCRLPSGVTQVSRGGTTYTITADLFEDGRTGIREVDAWIRRYNPYALKTPSTVYSPDTVRR